MNNVAVFYTCIKNIHLNKGMATGYMYDGGKYVKVSRTIPPVFHNRTILKHPADLRKLSLLRRRCRVFNGQTRYSKYIINQLLYSHSKLKSHIPPTKLLSKAGLQQMMNRHQNLYIKPASGSLGLGIMKLAKRKAGKWLLQSNHKTIQLNGRQVYGVVLRSTQGKQYIVQKGIQLAKYRGKPYDIRVTVQKGTGGAWNVAGMVGKVAARHKHVTNIARGGSAVRCNELFKASGLNAAIMNRRIGRFSLQIAKRLDHKLKQLGDMGLDIGVSDKGKPYFIEMNGRDLRYSFKEAGMHNTWFRTYANPIQYAKYLSRK
jgi:hypothetical protein